MTIGGGEDDKTRRFVDFLLEIEGPLLVRVDPIT